MRCQDDSVKYNMLQFVRKLGFSGSTSLNFRDAQSRVSKKKKNGPGPRVLESFHVPHRWEKFSV